jgi:hypothetical protein
MRIQVLKNHSYDNGVQDELPPKEDILGEMNAHNKVYYRNSLKPLSPSRKTVAVIHKTLNSLVFSKAETDDIPVMFNDKMNVSQILIPRLLFVSAAALGA